jgi:AcrR family transcriptional regulator
LVEAEGAEALTLARLAERLKIRIPSLYNHVAGSADLRLTLALRVARETAAAMRTAALGRSGADALARMADAYRGYVMVHPNLYALAVRVPPPADSALRAEMDAPVAVVVAVLAACDVTGEAAVHAVRALRSAVHGFAMLELAANFQLPADVNESFCRMISALIAGLVVAR